MKVRKTYKFPVYLSAGQEFIASTIAEKISELKISPDIFIQHRGIQLFSFSEVVVIDE